MAEIDRFCETAMYIGHLSNLSGRKPLNCLYHAEVYCILTMPMSTVSSPCRGLLYPYHAEVYCILRELPVQDKRDAMLLELILDNRLID